MDAPVPLWSVCPPVTGWRASEGRSHAAELEPIWSDFPASVAASPTLRKSPPIGAGRGRASDRGIPGRKKRHYLPDALRRSGGAAPALQSGGVGGEIERHPGNERSAVRHGDRRADARGAVLSCG